MELSCDSHSGASGYGSPATGGEVGVTATISVEVGVVFPDVGVTVGSSDNVEVGLRVEVTVPLGSDVSVRAASAVLVNIGGGKARLFSTNGKNAVVFSSSSITTTAYNSETTH